MSMLYQVFIKGDRFGGALDGAARQFSEALDKGWSPMQFVNEQRRIGKHIMGIGHRVKSVCFWYIYCLRDRNDFGRIVDLFTYRTFT